MKHLFIINPAAGGKKTSASLVADRAVRTMSGISDEYELYTTKAPMDACSKIRTEALSRKELRVYACGGDGTLNECVNGAAGSQNVAVAHYPCGTGNDFIKTFEADKDVFFDLGRLVRGFVRPVDVIDVNGRLSINICSVGIDARIGADVHKYSSLPLIGGSTGYVVSLIVNFFKQINMPMTVKSGGETFDGEFALMCACNGRYYGGGFNPIPEAVPNDGIMDVLLVRKTSRLQVLSLIGKYASGRYKELGEMAIRLNTEDLEIASPSQFVINVDGESIWSDRAHFRMIHNGVNMIFPLGASYFDSQNL